MLTLSIPASMPMPYSAHQRRQFIDQLPQAIHFQLIDLVAGLTGDSGVVLNPGDWIPNPGCPAPLQAPPLLRCSAGRSSGTIAPATGHT